MGPSPCSKVGCQEEPVAEAPAPSRCCRRGTRMEHSARPSVTHLSFPHSPEMWIPTRGPASPSGALLRYSSESQKEDVPALRCLQMSRRQREVN